ncbi:MAG TPA: hypothetical protein PKA81_13650 [Clostridia bacterium]|nr:hypothetical protein [Clostridia bacterium]
MFSVREAFGICNGQFREWPSNLRVYMAFLFGMAVSSVPVLNYLDFAKALQEPMNAVEPFIILQTLREQMTILLLGLLLLLSDAPFINQRSTYSIIRVSRKSWAVGMILYVVAAAFLYYLVMLVFSIGLVSARAYFGNFWSDAIYSLANMPSVNSSIEFGIYFPYIMIVKSLSPLQAVFHTVCLASIYGAILALVVFTVSMRNNRIYGLIAALVVHAAGYIMVSEAYINIPKASLLANTLLGFHTFSSGATSGITLTFSYILLGVVAILLAALAILLSRKLDCSVSLGEKK